MAIIKWNAIVKYSIVITLALSMNVAAAEYYVVYSSDGPCCTHHREVRVACRKVVHHKKKVRHYKACARRYYKPRSTYRVSVTYACPIYESCCPMRPRCSAFSPCHRAYPVTRICSYQGCGERVYYVDDADDFYYDRRTADDIGAELNIDY